MIMMKDNMFCIKVNPNATKSEWMTLCEKWDNESNVRLDTSMICTLEDIELVADIAFSNLEHDLSLSLMTDLAEKELTPEYLLKKIFDIGDQGCKETVCLRKNLSISLEEKCMSCTLVHRKNE